MKHVKIVLLLVVLFSCSKSDDKGSTATAPTESSTAESTTTSTTAPELGEHETWTARVKENLTEIQIYESEDASQPFARLDNPDHRGTPAVLYVIGTEISDPRIEVLLPTPPNGSKGWINSSDVDFVKNQYRIIIELEAHKMTVTNQGEEVINTSVGVGREGRETPTGLYFIKELLQPPDPNGTYGPFAYGISGSTNNPEVASEFEGGGVIGIHGTNQPEALGTDVSSGCIRVNNSVITDMVDFIPLGTPVEIRS